MKKIDQWFFHITATISILTTFGLFMGIIIHWDESYSYVWLISSLVSIGLSFIFN